MFSGKGEADEVDVTATHKPTGKTTTFTAYIVEFDEGTYFLQNRKTGKYAQHYSTQIKQATFDGANDQKWNLVFAGGGYYAIINKHNNYAVTVPSGRETSNSTNLTLTTYSATNNQKWSITLTDNGSYKIKAKCAKDTTNPELVFAVQTGSGDNIQQNDYIPNNGSYKDEWYVDSMLPTSGYEITYNPSNWGSSQNCYSYALNYNDGWLEPGYSIRTSSHISSSEITEATILRYIEQDSEYSGFTFESIGKYEVCPEGTYKIAIVIDRNVDIHFYRQNPDGYWSHKRGSNTPTLVDSKGAPIYDPQKAARSYGNWLEGVLNWDVNYDIFIGYYYVTPLE